MVTISVLVLLLFANTVLWLPGLIAISLKLFYDPYMNIRPYMLRLPLLYAVDWMRVLVAICMWLVFFGTIAWLIHDLALVVNNSSNLLELDTPIIRMDKMASESFRVGDRVTHVWVSNGIRKEEQATILKLDNVNICTIQFDNPYFGYDMLNYDERLLHHPLNKTNKAYQVPYSKLKIFFAKDLLSVINSFKRDGLVPPNFKELITEYIEKRVG